MEILLLLLPKFFHDWLVGDFSFSEDEYFEDKKPIAEGIKLIEAEDFIKAFYFFNQSVEKYPKNAFAYFYRGKCHYHFENIEAALADFDKTLRLDSTIGEAFVMKGKCLYQLEAYEDALKEYRRASRKQHDKNPELLRLVGELEIRTGNFESARKTLKLAIELGDEIAEQYYQTINFKENYSNIKE